MFVVQLQIVHRIGKDLLVNIGKVLSYLCVSEIH